MNSHHAKCADRFYQPACLGCVDAREAELQTEIDRLRVALQTIADMAIRDGEIYMQLADRAQKIACDALLK